MKKLLLSVVLLFASVCAFGQGSTVPFPPAVNSQGNFLSFAKITFCTTPATLDTLGNCTNTVTVYKDQALTQPYSSAILTDGIGYFPPNANTATSLWFSPAANLCYTLTTSSMTSPATNPCTPFSVSITPGSSPTFAGGTFTGNVSVGGTLLAAVTGSTQTINSSTAGADICAKIATGIAALPSTGGTVDARFFQGTQACATNPFAALSKNVHLVLGNVAIASTVPWAFTTTSNFFIEGADWSQTSISCPSCAAATPAVVNIGTASPTINQIFGVQIKNLQISGGPNVTDALYMTGVHHSQFENLDLRNVTGACLHTQFAVTDSFPHIYCTLNHGTFTTQPTNGFLFGQIDSNHQTTSGTCVDPIVEGVSGTGIKYLGAIQMFCPAGTSEQNTRGIETAAVSGNNRQNTFLGMDLETGGTTIDDVLFNSLGDMLINAFAFTKTHIGSTAINARVIGGITNQLTIDAGAINTQVDGMVFNNSATGTCVDNGTDSIIRVYNAATNQRIGCPWTWREVVPIFGSAVGNIDRQDTLWGAYSFTTAATTISNSVITAGTRWRIIFMGEWESNFEGAGLTQPAPYIEVTNVAPTFAIGATTLTVAINGSNQFTVTASANSIAFSGRIFVTSHDVGSAGTTSLLVKDAISTAGQLISTVATGTAPLSVSSTTPVANLTASNHPTEQNCGTTTTCAHTADTAVKIVRGSAPLVSGTPSVATVTGFSPAFTSSSSFVCTATNATTQANPIKVVNASSSSITLTGPATVTDTVNYICIGT